MNVLKQDKRIQIISALVEGASIRSISRMTGVHKTTIQSLLYDVGAACEQLLSNTMRNLKLRSVQADEIWCFVGKKQRQVTPEEIQSKGVEIGDQWIWVAMDADTKLVPVYVVGKRTNPYAVQFARELSTRIEGRFQLTTDAYGAYNYAVKRELKGKVDYAQVIKQYGDNGPPEELRKYSPAKCIKATKYVVSGSPCIDDISTSYVERQNLTMRMQIRRLTRLTNAYSKSLKGLKSSIALHFAHYNFCRVHSTIGKTPATEAGVTNYTWSVADLLVYSN